MEEITGPVIAIALVLSAVFMPCAFLGGITGQFFRQFAVTIAVSTVISAFNSLTLSPALCAPAPRHGGSKGTLRRRCREVLPVSCYRGWADGRRRSFVAAMRSRSDCRCGAPAARRTCGPDRRSLLVHWRGCSCRRIGRLASSAGCSSSRSWCSAFFRAFNRVFDARDRASTRRVVGWSLRVSAHRARSSTAACSALTYVAIRRSRRRASFPPQDKGYLLLNVQLPDSALGASGRQQVMRPHRGDRR